METHKIYDKKGKGFTRIFTTDEVVNVNPIEFYKNFFLIQKAIMLKDLLSVEKPDLIPHLSDSFYIEEAKKNVDLDFFKQFEDIEVNPNFIELLKTTKKNDQKKLLKGQSLNPDELMAMIFKSYSEFGYLYSRYRFEILPPNFEGKKLPKMFNLNADGSIEKTGETDLTDGELKSLITQRKVIVPHFFEKNNVWHCFFATYNGLYGKENWKDGQAHYHYISSSFGISKDDFIESMRTGNYKSTPIHIDLLEYRNQGDANN